MSAAATNFLRKTINLYLIKSATISVITATTAFKVALYTNNITGQNFDTDTGEYGTVSTPYASVANSGNEFVGTNYTAGGVALPTLTNDVDATGHLARINATAVTTFTNLTYTTNGAAGALVYDNSGSAKAGLIWVNFGSILTPTAADLIIKWNANTSPYTLMTFG